MFVLPLLVLHDYDILHCQLRGEHVTQVSSSCLQLVRDRWSNAENAHDCQLVLLVLPPVAKLISLLAVVHLFDARRRCCSCFCRTFALRLFSDDLMGLLRGWSWDGIGKPSGLHEQGRLAAKSPYTSNFVSATLHARTHRRSNYFELVQAVKEFLGS